MSEVSTILNSRVEVLSRSTVEILLMCVFPHLVKLCKPIGEALSGPRH
jgi:hypothetical protein